LILAPLQQQAKPNCLLDVNFTLMMKKDAFTRERADVVPREKRRKNS
jgi:hypothetical protein